VRVRIQWKQKPSRTSDEQDRIAALLLASLAAPCALLAFTMAFWRVAADLHWTRTFVIANGVFSHWQTWLASAAILFLIITLLDRYGQGGHSRRSPE
jgi:hypothetical protein